MPTDEAIGARVIAALRAALAADCEADLSIELIGDRGAVRVGVDRVYSFHPDFAAAAADLERRVADTIEWWESFRADRIRADRLRAEQAAALRRAADAVLLDPSTAPASAIAPRADMGRTGPSRPRRRHPADHRRDGRAGCQSPA